MTFLFKLQEFFRSQYDYIYFFCFISFLILSAVCFSARRDGSHKMPWIFLSLFGLVQAVNESADIFIVFDGSNRLFSMIKLALLMVSFILLFEFALAGISGGFKARHPLIYMPAIALVLYSGKFGFEYSEAVARYFLAFPAGVLSSWFFYRSYRLQTKGRGALFFLIFVMLIYAAAAGLITPKADIWLAGRLNAEYLFNSFAVPVQFIRGILILCAAMAVWFYSQSSLDKTPGGDKYNFRFKPFKWAMIITIFALICLGWIFTNYMDYYASKQITKNVRTANPGSPINELNRQLSKLRTGAVMISVSSRIIYALTLPEPRFIERAHKRLEAYAKAYSALDCFLMDSKGRIVASASNNPEEAPSGSDFAGMPYFKDAVSGKIGYFFIRGADNEERIYYVSAPVKKSGGGILGAAVIKKKIIVKPILQYRLISIIITFFICSLSVIFFITVKKREKLITLIDEANRKLEAVDKMKNDFLSSVSHDLRTPLAAIKNSATLLSKGWPDRRHVDEKQMELINVILSNTDRQIRMIRDLLDISKIEAGVISAGKESMDIIALARDVVKIFRPLADEKRITLELIFGESRLNAICDPEHCRRIFSNLLDNAVKFTPAGGAVRVILKKGANYIEAIVSDTGIGIPQEEIGNLFNKFYMSSVTKCRREGCGLGLAISKGLVEAHGGKIWAVAWREKGSSFHFTLPAVKYEILLKK